MKWLESLANLLGAVGGEGEAWSARLGATDVEVAAGRVAHALEVLSRTGAAESDGRFFWVWLFHWNTLAVVVLLAIHAMAWFSTPRNFSASRQPDDERQLGLTAIGNAVNVGMTALSLLFAATGLMLFQAGQEIPPVSREYLQRGQILFLVALAFGVFMLFRSPMLAHRGNVARADSVGGWLGVFFVFFVVGLSDILVAVVCYTIQGG